MWLHWDGNSYADAEAGVFTSATVDGNYTLREPLPPEQQHVARRHAVQG